ncbi:P1 family peptidase [Clostridiisalibacter paucivorans]|uniref:P1 family peptidase n=1 Tax=Clostridiisalibacter paucivorans TaxID=408753 RepID=UPI00047B0E10|nr:P1 family peptidase [Clostridiisalibacter paucivorans]
MQGKKRIDSYGINIGILPKGKKNKITDVKGIRVGHCTIDTSENKTGITVILPTEDNIYQNKLVAASHVINGYGKTLGLIQIDELGTLESILALTNTLNVGLVHDAVVEYMIEKSKKDGLEIKSINPIIAECNDSYLNDIQMRAVKQEHVFKAIKDAKVDFQEGDVGAGKGMSCHQLKGGIGSASRTIMLDDEKYTVGILVLSNHGKLKDLTIDGRNVGRKIYEELNVEDKNSLGSIISVIATDIPLSSRQLKRICKRTVVGLSRTGSFIGNGSGEIVIAFSTGNTIRYDQEILSLKVINENKIDIIFRAVAECEEEAILNSMITANRVVGIGGKIRESLKNVLDGNM